MDTKVRLVCLTVVIIFVVIYCVCSIVILITQGIIMSMKNNSTCFDQDFSHGDQIRNGVMKILPMEIIFALAIEISQIICLSVIVHSVKHVNKFSLVKERFWYSYLWQFTFVMFAIPTRFLIELGSKEWNVSCKEYKLLFVLFIVQLIISPLTYCVGFFVENESKKKSNEITMTPYDNQT